MKRLLRKYYFKKKLVEPRTQEDLGDELCNHCHLHEDGEHSFCEGSNCESAYDNYLEFIDELNQ